MPFSTCHGTFYALEVVEGVPVATTTGPQIYGGNEDGGQKQRYA